MDLNNWENIVAATAPERGEDTVLRAMRRRPREAFLPRPQQARAAENIPLPIGYDQTNSQPSTVADMLRLLDVRPGHKVLDVGAGSGWTTAILGDLVTETGSVLGIELVPGLADRAQGVLQRQHLPWTTIKTARRGTLGAPEYAPFDRILVSAEPRHLPAELVAQLAPDGVLVITVAGELLRVVRHGDDPANAQITRHGAYRFVQLITE